MRNQSETNDKIRKKEMLIRQLRRDCILKIAALAILVAAAWLVIPAANNLIFAAGNNLIYATGSNFAFDEGNNHAFAAGNNVAFAAVNNPVRVEIPLKYVADGDAGEREFVLKAEDPASPMPEGSAGGEHRIILSESAETSLGTITYYNPGAYDYTVCSNADPSVYRLQVIATNDGQGTLIIHKNGEEGKTDLVFRSINGGNGEDNGGDEDHGGGGSIEYGGDQGVDPFGDPGTTGEQDAAADPGIPTISEDESIPTNGINETPQTGDETAVILWITLAGLSLICLTCLLAAAGILPRRQQ